MYASDDFNVVFADHFPFYKMAKRFTFGEHSFAILQDIILNEAAGKFARIIRDRNSAKNFEKLAAWTEVTRLFNEVPNSCYLSFRSCTGRYRIYLYGHSTYRTKVFISKGFSLSLCFVGTGTVPTYMRSVP